MNDTTKFSFKEFVAFVKKQAKANKECQYSEPRYPSRCRGEVVVCAVSQFMVSKGIDFDYISPDGRFARKQGNSVGGWCPFPVDVAFLDLPESIGDVHRREGTFKGILGKMKELHWIK